MANTVIKPVIRRKGQKFESNSISLKTDVFFNVLFSTYCIFCIAPLILIFMISITDERSLIENGYTFFPNKINFISYKFLFSDFSTIVNAYVVTILVCVIGTFLSVLMTLLYSYPLSRTSFKYRNFFSFFIFFTMLFQGGLVPWYILYTQYLKLSDKPAVLVIPALVSAFNVLIVKTFLSTSLPDSVMESARIDGAREFRIFFSIVIPLSLPVIATIALFSVLAYWNDWYLCLLFIKSKKYFNIQYTMYQALRSIEFLSQIKTSDAKSSLLQVPGETLRMAMAIIGIGPIVFAYPFFQKYFIKGLTIGAVKG